ncbi:hypothetical protein EDC56_2498 [Sinobacterium caligoides]|uniref:Uncharacterized protein n=1 Tax=Sinobacterium caligoides TaxID=933926 RepID=A0A3N2DQF1_9GAMM|nr:hypothetical protein [Sinobacterium caligoides]ROS02048.1 hypothetical protein EDC56_2498 [Sinobacterium caligoides]
MEYFRKVSGVFLVVIGVVVLVVLVINMNDYVQEFSNNPIHHYIVATDKTDSVIKIGEATIVVSESVYHFAALLLGFLFLRVWVEVGSTLVKTGRVLITNDAERVEQLVEKLVNKKT